ncbi:M23 family metallopeptidase [Paenibacillus chartarius]|uniref:M23 family metallopeptidase n=1 Tax=Paenibacillus chartarius TaxID=747481 RepID=A0ABV6DRW8_9BACL
MRSFRQVVRTMLTNGPKLLLTGAAVFVAGALEPVSTASAAAEPAASAVPAASAAPKDIYKERMQMFEMAGTITGIPWYELAAVDQYERAMGRVRKLPTASSSIAIHFSEVDWAGALNPNLQDTSPASIALFRGVGRDGDGDGQANRLNDVDRLSAMAALMVKQGLSADDRRRSLWNYYQNDRSVERIGQFARIYQQFGRLDLHEQAFVMPLNAEYSYRSTWGAKRGWGGRRIHEGTDVFASHGVPVRSACYGIVEVKGWNPYGGWRVGIRDLNNVYYYFAHLSGFPKELKLGKVVKPGEVLGWVGSTGYGRPGTSGKFPPHLHFGMYRDNGYSDWSFDPYSYLRKWEREERRRANAERSK